MTIARHTARLVALEAATMPAGATGHVVVYRMGEPMPPAPARADFVLYLPDNGRGQS
jgi:hypothetical protein